MCRVPCWSWSLESCSTFKEVCLLAKMGKSGTLSGQLGAAPLASLATDSGPSWRKTWVLYGIYWLYTFNRHPGAKPFKSLTQKKFHYLKLKARGQYRIGSVCLDAYSKHFVGLRYKMFSIIPLDFLNMRFNICILSGCPVIGEIT